MPAASAPGLWITRSGRAGRSCDAAARRRTLLVCVCEIICVHKCEQNWVDVCVCVCVCVCLSGLMTALNVCVLSLILWHSSKACCVHVCIQPYMFASVQGCLYRA